ncbi:hypothetical protein BBF96_10515 [Anoxybacter fermentans]|uniref:Aminoglycoside phosphotransferase domain-containing protein n=1 Tax=Anoxybacter fermentans TaxID=1323375 RepID=A0A3Q9HRG3_9FIRM|nr:hypothetical protein [Anoxybacter fermentans]AZR73780.1 hypothetical protein BBF96_10515 [Anoxybacter fermentans]
MTEKSEIAHSLHQVALTRYSITFESAIQTEDGLLLKDDNDEYYHLKKYSGERQELLASLEAEEYLLKNGFKWAVPSIPMIGGETNLKYDGQDFYLKKWQPGGVDFPFRWHYQLGSEILAWIHQAGEGFQPGIKEGWEWPDWVQLFEMARDTIYELHTTIIDEKEEKLAKYFDKTVSDAFRAMQEAIIHLKKAGYYEQRLEGMSRGYISLSQVPAPTLGMEFDLLNLIIPDLPACGLGAYLGQLGHWRKVRVINDVIDLITAYNHIRPLKSEEIDLIKGFLKFPWHFWWVTEKYFLREKEKKRNKKYAKALRKISQATTKEIYSALLEL